jgi:hypothetical protein
VRTINERSRRAGVPLGPVAALLLCLGPVASATAADDKTQEVDAGGLTFQAPAAWKQSPPQTQMRRAQLKIEPAKGDDAKEGAEVVVFAFPGGAGTVDQNVERWQRQFRDKDGNPPKVDVKTVDARNAKVNRVEMAGHYTPMTFPGQPKQEEKDDYRLVAGIVLTEDTGYFIRLVGPEKTVKAARDDFDKLLASIKVDKGK